MFEANENCSFDFYFYGIYTVTLYGYFVKTFVGCNRTLPQAEYNATSANMSPPPRIASKSAAKPSS